MEKHSVSELWIQSYKLAWTASSSATYEYVWSSGGTNPRTLN